MSSTADPDATTRARIEEHWKVSQYFADPFPAASWRAELAEPIPPHGPSVTVSLR